MTAPIPNADVRRTLRAELATTGKPEARCDVEGCRGFYKWAYLRGAWTLTSCGRCGRQPDRQDGAA